MKHIFCSVIFLLIAFIAKSQEEQSILWTTWDEYGLKGKVKEYRSRMIRHYDFDSVPHEKQLEYDFRHSYGFRQIVTGTVRFNEWGFKTYSREYLIDTTVTRNYAMAAVSRSRQYYLYTYDPRDIKFKQDISGCCKQPQPVFSPNRINGNYNSRRVPAESPKESRVSRREYVYEVINDTLRSELKLINYGTPNLRKVFEYLSEKITRQNIIFYENLEPEYRLFMLEGLFVNVGIQVGIDAEMYFEYEYDKSDRIIVSRLVEDGEIIWQEEYHYKAESLRPASLDRFIVSARTGRRMFSDYSHEDFNEHGDIIKSEYFDKERKLVRTRFYDYEYDEVGNWTQCEMYLYGGKERTEEPTITILRELDYFEK